MTLRKLGTSPMKTPSILPSGWWNLGQPWQGAAKSAASWLKLPSQRSFSVLILLMGGWSVCQTPVFAQGYGAVSPPFVPTAAEPLPVGGGVLQPASGQQYVVYVEGDSSELLNQVRVLEPSAFLTTVEGRSVIQTGRFNSLQNAQQQLDLLAIQGLGTGMAEVPAVMVSYAQAPVSGGSVYSGSTYGVSAYGSSAYSSSTYSDGLPPLPVVPVPAASVPTAPAASVSQATSSLNVEFGQAPNFPTAAPTGNATMETSPPPVSTVQSVTPTAPVVNAPYYVVIPAGQDDLPNVTSRVIQLGAPADRVRSRTRPLGPHVAIGPFQDRGLAEQWSGFFRDAGYRSSRVHFEP